MQYLILLSALVSLAIAIVFQGSDLAPEDSDDPLVLAGGLKQVGTVSSLPEEPLADE